MTSCMVIMMNINDIQVGQGVYVIRSSPMPEKGVVTRLVCHGSEKYVIVAINGREHRCRVNWLSDKPVEVTDEQFEQWWEFEGSATENLFHWYAQNYALVSLEGVMNSAHLSIMIKAAMYEQATGRKWSGFTGDKTK